jgi:hypothetical protein
MPCFHYDCTFGWGGVTLHDSPPCVFRLTVDRVPEQRGQNSGVTVDRVPEQRGQNSGVTVDSF